MFLKFGVHIADVSHFVRPGTAIDLEGSSRGTTVYLCDRRIDMLPELLSGNLCSLRGNEERLATFHLISHIVFTIVRYAFSVIWTMTDKAEIMSVKFHKSLICSKAALTYARAQEIIDDPKQVRNHCACVGLWKFQIDGVAIGLRGLMKLSKVLKNKRTANGALTLASSEVRLHVCSIMLLIDSF